jgi:hypothetical protein
MKFSLLAFSLLPGASAKLPRGKERVKKWSMENEIKSRPSIFSPKAS